MNNINRVLVKQQAKDIIKGKFFYLFLVALIVNILSGVSFNIDFNLNNNNFELFRDNNSNHSYENDQDYFNDFDYDNPIEGFEFNSFSDKNVSFDLPDFNFDYGIKPNKISIVMGVVFAPLTVTLAGMFLALVRRNPNEQFNLGTELGGIFKNSFNHTYWKKLATELLTALIAVALMVLFIVPGIIFAYSAYFVREIISDNPNLKPMEAIKLSKKIVYGNRTELFILDLSFIPWYLLCAVTLGLGCIYVWPYVYTTKALYYENFRMRALQEGRITGDDFLSFNEKYSAYRSADNGANGSPNYNTGGYSYTNPDMNKTANSNSNYYYSQPNAYYRPDAAGNSPTDPSNGQSDINGNNTETHKPVSGENSVLPDENE